MQISDISLPEVYKESADFRFFCKWFETALTRIKYDTENLIDLYDALRCPDDLLWMLGDTIGYKYDDRLPAAFNRLVILYFMSLIRNKGSKDGVTLAAEVNLAQFNILEQGKKDDILYSRLDNPSIPVNSAYVSSNVEDGYIDIVYFADTKPIDACIEYVRPVGMYVFQYAGVRYDGKTRVSIDAKLTDSEYRGVSIGPTHVGHYSREDYARLQRTDNPDPRGNIYYRNSEYEKDHLMLGMSPGQRALYSLQLSNNSQIVKSLLKDPIFEVGYGPISETDVTTYSVRATKRNARNDSDKPWNLRYHKNRESALGKDIYTVESGSGLNPNPAVNPIMSQLGDAIAINSSKTQHTEIVDDKVTVVDIE